MAKFKVGDKVRILDGSKIENYTGSWAIFGGMNKYIGTIQTIEEVDEDWSDGRVSYYMEDIGYSWDERGLELATEQKQPKFKVGDKVRAKKDAPYTITTDGWTGEVVKVYDHESIRVFGEGVLGLKENRDGFYVDPQYFDLVEEHKIVISTDGKITTATLYDGKQRIKSAKAKCAPGDTFDFNYGASLALDRLTGQKCGKVKTTLKSKSFDWDGFKAGKFNVVTNRDNIDRFLKECDDHNIEFDNDKASNWNPIKKYDEAPEFMKMILKATLDFKSTDKCDFKVNNNNGKLEYSFKLNITEKTVIYD